MTLINATPARLLCVLVFGAVLAGCNNKGNDAVRTGPQAVHPSPSALAQGTPALTCGAEGQPACE